MKKLAILLTIITTCLIQAQHSILPLPPPQYDTTLYEGMVVYNPITYENAIYSQDNNVNFVYNDTLYVGNPPEQVVQTLSICYNRIWTFGFMDWRRAVNCDNFPYGYCMIGGPNNVYATSFAQPWHLDSSAVICGVALYAHPYPNCYYQDTLHYGIMDTNYNLITQEDMRHSGVIYTERMDGATIVHDTIYHGSPPFDNHYFTQLVEAKDFYLFLDLPHTGYNTFLNWTLCYSDDSCLREAAKREHLPFDTIFVGDFYYTEHSILMAGGAIHYSRGMADHFSFDIPVKDTIPLWQSPYSPAVKRYTRWRKFSEDSVYRIYQRCFIQLLPIILVPKVQSANIDDTLLINNTWVYPNPAKNEINIISGFQINNVYIYDLNGKLIKSLGLKSNEIKVDISNFEKGTYIVDIRTNRGRVSKKFIKQ